MTQEKRVCADGISVSDTLAEVHDLVELALDATANRQPYHWSSSEFRSYLGAASAKIEMLMASAATK